MFLTPFMWGTQHDGRIIVAHQLFRGSKSASARKTYNYPSRFGIGLANAEHSRNWFPATIPSYDEQQMRFDYATAGRAGNCSTF